MNHVTATLVGNDQRNMDSEDLDLLRFSIDGMKVARCSPQRDHGRRASLCSGQPYCHRRVIDIHLNGAARLLTTGQHQHRRLGSGGWGRRNHHAALGAPPFGEPITAG